MSAAKHLVTAAWRSDTAHPFPRLAAGAAFASVAVLGALALGAAGVRVLPWLLDEGVPWRVAIPFARAVASVAAEAGVLVGWPIGWALAAHALIERGEARVLAMLGERPARTAWRLAPVGLVFAGSLACASLAGGRDASEPGSVVASLVAQGRAACARGGARVARVPLVGATWLCGPGGEGGARLVGQVANDTIYDARDVAIEPDARRVSLDDAWVAGPRASVHADHVRIALPPFVRASRLAPGWRAALLASSAGVAGGLAVWVLLSLGLRADRAERLWRLHAIFLGGAGPIATLSVLHALERRDASAGTYAVLPVIAAVVTGFVAALLWIAPARRARSRRAPA